MAHSDRLGPSIIRWINSLAPSLNCLSELDSATNLPKRTLTELKDLNDGIILGEIVGEIDPAYFRLLSASSNSKALSENWVLRFNNLKRLYKLVIRYFEDVLHTTTNQLIAPNLQLIAKAELGYEEEICRLAGLILALVVQSDKKEIHVERIRSLEEWVQRELMLSIEQIVNKVGIKPEKEIESKQKDPDTDFYDLQHERSQLVHDKDALQIAYEALLVSHNALKEDHEQALAGLAAAEKRATEASKTTTTSEASNQANEALKNELERVRSQLETAETQLNETESIVETQQKSLEDLTRKVEELTPRAAESVRLKDEMDEIRHTLEKAKKTENVLEKYKKKLEESADLRRNYKALEDQNSDLVDKNVTLEEEKKKLAALKPLMESYKSKLDTLEINSNKLVKENLNLTQEIEQTRNKLVTIETEREKERQQSEILQTRLKEFEEAGSVTKPRQKGDEEAEDVFEDEFSVTSSMTDLKLEIRKLKRQLAAAPAGQADSSQLLLLENQMQDSNRLKTRYEQENLNQHAQILSLESRLAQILAGKSEHEDGPAATVALRLRLKELEQEFERLRREHDKLKLDYEAQSERLIQAETDLKLVGKEEREILKSLHESVSVEKRTLAEKVAELRESLQRAKDENLIQLNRLNSLLLEKISLQSDGIEHRNRLIENERNLGDLKVSMASKSDENQVIALKTEIETLKQKLQKAKAFIKEQDELFRERHASDQHDNLEQAAEAYESQIQTLSEEILRQKTLFKELEIRYQLEQKLILSAWHELGMKQMRQNVLNSANTADSTSSNPRPAGVSFLSKQRARTNGAGLRYA